MMVRNEIAYENAIKRNIIANAQKTFSRTFPRANEAIDFLVVQNNRPKPFALWESFYDSYITYGKLTEKQYECIIKAIDKAAEKKLVRDMEIEEAKAKSNYIGTVGKREVFSNVKVEKVITIEASKFSYYDRDTQEIYIMSDMNGNRIIYKTKSYQEIKEGDILKVTATVKEQREYKGEKQTVIQRPKFEASAN